MKKTLLIALILTLSAGMAIAQQKGGPGFSQGGAGNPGQGSFQAGNRGNPVDRLTERLGLDETQAAEIALIFEENQLLRDEERDRNRAISDEIRVNTHARIMEVLGPEQQALFEAQLRDRDQLRQALEEIRADRGFGGRGPRDCDN